MILIKIGGGKQINIDEIAKDIASLIKNGEKVIVVHGANGYVKEYSAKLGIEEKTIVSPSGHTSRYTNHNTLDLLTMVYSGLVNKKIVSQLQKNGVNAIGLTGADGKIWQGIRKENILSIENGKTKLVRDSLTGVVTGINVVLLQYFIQNNYIPVLTIPAITENGELINVDNDRAIAFMVKALKINMLISLFEAPGILSEYPISNIQYQISNKTNVVKKINKANLNTYIQDTQGRMRKKLLGLQEAFSNGLKKAYFGDGRIKNPIMSAMKGEGTVIE